MKRWLSLLLISILWLTACTSASPTPEARLTVVATTSIVTDVVRQIGGEHVQVISLLPVGADPHTFEPRPQDLTLVANAQQIFVNGAGLEAHLLPLLESAGAMEKVIEVSEGIPLLPMEEVIEHHHEEEEEGAEDHHHHHHLGGDPHTWTDPNNVLLWTENIASALAAADPAHASTYRQNAATYQDQLRELDGWIREQVAQVPAENRLLVLDHAVLGYFAEEYGFRQLGAILPSFSTEAAPSAQELADLVERIRSLGVKAIFISETAHIPLASRVAEESGVKLVMIYHDLSPADGPAPDYLSYMRYNVRTIVEALR